MADFKIKSTAGTGNKTLIQSQDQSGSSYAIEIGDGGASIIKPSSIKTVTNSYDAIKFGELNSKGYLNHNFLGCAYYLSSVKAIAHGTWTEIDSTWTKMTSSGNAGADDADIFGKFSSGRWTPTVAGYYLCNGSIRLPGLDDAEYFHGALRRNGDTASGNKTEVITKSPNSNATLAVNVSGIFALDTNDYVSLWCFHDEGASQDASTAGTHFFATYLGTSDL